MRKFAHVPVQSWRGWDPNDLFGGWFSALGGFKTLIGANMMIIIIIIYKYNNNLIGLRSMLNTALSGSTGATVYQDYYGGRYRKKNSCTCNDAMKIQAPRSK
jgi:hypothetical protein